MPGAVRRPPIPLGSPSTRPALRARRSPDRAIRRFLALRIGLPCAILCPWVHAKKHRRSIDIVNRPGAIRPKALVGDPALFEEGVRRALSARAPATLVGACQIHRAVPLEHGLAPRLMFHSYARFAAAPDDMPLPDIAESAHLRIRPTMLSDLDFMASVEHDARNLPFTTPWARPRHEGAVRFPGSRRVIVDAGETRAPVGFVILQGGRRLPRSAELKRIALQIRRRGLGRACVRLLKGPALRDRRAHRSRLAGNSGNARAPRLYAGEGFVEEGRLREGVRPGADDAVGWDSPVDVSVLRRECGLRVASGLETPFAARPA